MDYPFTISIFDEGYYVIFMRLRCACVFSLLLGYRIASFEIRARYDDSQVGYSNEFL